MNIKAIRSDDIYRKMMTASKEEKENIYRYELMKPFEFKWQCIGIPLKSETDGGYACGYALIQHYLEKTGKSIYEATITPTADILNETETFWK